jgi:uncharacterized protein
MIFEIHAERNKTDKKIFYYDNETNTLKDETGIVYESQQQANTKNQSPVVPFSKDVPLKKSRAVKLVKIQMGLSCNYACDYCSQKFVERPKETNPKDIENFMKLFNELEFDEQRGLKVEFWGGEPFVYWKTFKPLAEAIAKKFSEWKQPPKFSVITNGSLLTEDICAWLYAMGFSVAISHDGPGQYVRGPDPFDDPETKKTVLEFYKVMSKEGRMSFNSMLNAKNTSRKLIHEWFVDFTKDPMVPLGEGGFVDAYDEDGLASSLQSKRDMFEFRRKAFADIFVNDGYIGFGGIIQKIDGFTNAVLTHKHADYLGQKCGMDEEDTISFDLRGNVITCQNVSATETSKNGESHLGGNLSDFDNISINTATHWRNREECSKCPVLHICQGACMFLEGEYWKASCNNAYSDAVPLFALSLEKITGYIPYLIKNTELPLERQDIWGTLYEHVEDPPKRKVIPIFNSQEKTILDGIEIFKEKTYD